MYCTHCGEFNRAGTTRCAKCGHALAPAPGAGTPNGRRCPMCGQVNAPDAIYCATCGARVLPLESVDEADLDILRPAQAPPAQLTPEAQMALNYERQHELFSPGTDKPLDPELERRLGAAAPEDRSRSRFGLPAGGGDGGLSWLDALRGSLDDGEPGDADDAEEAPPAPPARPGAGGPPSAAQAPLPAWLSRPSAPGGSAPAPEAEPTLPAWMSPPAPT